MASTDPLASARQAVFKPGTAEIGRARAEQLQTVGAERFREIATAMLAMPLPSTVGESLALAAEVVASGPRALARSAPQGSSLDASAAIVLRSGLKPDAKIAAVTTLLAGSATPSVADKALAVAYVKGSAWKGGYTLTHLKARVDGSTRPLADELKDAFERLGLGPSVWEDFARLASAELRSVGALRERPRAATQGAAGTPDQTNARARLPLDLKVRFEGLPGTGKATAAAAMHAELMRERTLGLKIGTWPLIPLVPPRVFGAGDEVAALLALLGERAPRPRASDARPTFATNDSGVRAEGERYDLLAEERASADARAAGYKGAAEALLPPTIAKRFDRTPLIFDPLPGDGPGGARARQAVFTAGPSGTGKTQAGIVESAEPNGFHLVQHTNPPRVPRAGMTQPEPGRFRRYVIEDVEGAGVSLGPAAGAQAPFGDNPRLMGLDDARGREISESIGTQLRELADGAIKSVKQK